MLHKEKVKQRFNNQSLNTVKSRRKLGLARFVGGTTFPLLALKCEKQTSNNHFAHEIGLVFSTYGETASVRTIYAII